MIFNSHTGTTVELNIPLSQPWAKDIIRKSAKTSGFAAARRDAKVKEVSKEMLPGGGQSNCISIVYEQDPSFIPQVPSKIVEERRRSA